MLSDGILDTWWDDPWTMIDLNMVPTDKPEPSIFGLFYPGKLHVAFGHKETMKTWTLWAACVDEASKGGRACWLDFEDDPATARLRLEALGGQLDAVEYYQPVGSPINEQMHAIAKRCSLMVIDSTTEFMSMSGLNGDAREDVAKMHRYLRTHVTAHGTAVVLIDHEVKSGDGASPSGSERKLSGIDGSALQFQKVREFGLGLTGEVRLRIAKDRPGALRSEPPTNIKFESDFESGAVHCLFGSTLEARILNHLRTNGRSSTNGIETAVGGRRSTVREALDQLVKDRRVSQIPGARNAKMFELAA